LAKWGKKRGSGNTTEDQLNKEKNRVGLKKKQGKRRLGLGNVWEGWQKGYSGVKGD